MKGCLIKHLQMRGGERWPGMTVQTEMRCTEPGGSSRMRPGPGTPSHGTPLTVAAGTVRCAGHHLGPRAVDRRPANPSGEALGRLKRSSPPGAMRSRPPNIARGTPRDGGLAVIRTSASLDVARRRGPRVFWTRRRPARPSSLGRAACHAVARKGEGGRTTNYELRRTRRRSKNTGDDARLLLTSE
jgi:hypothetical protein